MSSENAKIDNNFKRTLLGVTDDASAELRRLLVDSATGRLLISATITTGAITSLNGLTAAVQTFAVGTTGVDFAIVSGTSTHTFNLPTASATNRGALSSADWTTFNGKQSALSFPLATNLGGTGVANNALSTLTISGNFATTITVTNTTSVTLPVSGTLVSSVTTGNGVSATNTAGALSFTLGVITPTSVNGLTLVAAATGFTIAGGTTSKTLTVPLDASVSGTNTGDNAANSSTMYIGTTAVALNRASAALVLTGITSIDGNAASVTGLSVTSGKTLTVSESATIAINSITLGGGEVITFSATNALSLLTTGATSVTLPTTGTLVSSVTTGNGVSATNTAGALAFTLGVITPTSVNGLTITATAGTLTIPNNASASLITAGNFALTLTATAATNSTFPAGTHSLAPLDTPVFTTNITSPLVIGGAAAGSALTLESTSGVGTSDYISLLTGSQVERMRIYSAGIIDFNSQSRARVYQVTVQPIPTGASTRLCLSGETYDSQAEFNSATVSGTAEENGGVGLKDVGIFTEVAGYYTIMVAWNTTDNTYTTVAGKTSDDLLTLAANIFTVGETYTLYAARFVATKTGYYQVCGQVYYVSAVDAKYSYAGIWKDGAEVSGSYVQSPGIRFLTVTVSDIIYLATGSYLELYGGQDTGGNVNIGSGSTATFFSIHKLS